MRVGNDLANLAFSFAANPGPELYVVRGFCYDLQLQFSLVPDSPFGFTLGKNKMVARFPIDTCDTLYYRPGREYHFFYHAATILVMAIWKYYCHLPVFSS